MRGRLFLSLIVITGAAWPIVGLAAGVDCRTSPAPGPMAPKASRLVRVVASDGLRVPLDQPLDGDVACVWSADGADAAGVRTVAASACPGGVTHCAVLALAAGDLERKLDVLVGSASPVRVVVPPRRADVHDGLLYLLAVLGFVVSLVMSTWVAQRARIWRIRRAWEGIDRRLRLSQEDRPEILVRIRAILRFVHTRLFRTLPSLHDLELFEERLREADQILALSERKTLLWTRAAAVRLPPSVSTQFNAELRLFDRELLQLPLPFAVDALEAHVPSSLARAEALLEAVRPSWREDNAGLLEDLARATSLDDHLESAHLEGALAALLKNQLDHETTRLRELSKVETPSLMTEREVDLRLDVWRCMRRALYRLQDEQSGAITDRFFLGPQRDRLTAEVKAALEEWRRTDLTRLGPDRARRALWTLLHWDRHNSAIDHWLRGEPRVVPRARPTWRTFTPEVVALQISDRRRADFEGDYYWRSRIEVAWRCPNDGPPVVIGGRPFDPDLDGEAPDAQGGWIIANGPSTVAFATQKGALNLEACVRAPAEGHGAGEDAQAGPWVPWTLRDPGALFDIDVDEGIDDGRARQYFFSSYARLVLSLTANVTLASAIVSHAQQEPVAVLAGIKAFVLPLAIDHAALATLQLPMGLRRVISAIWKVVPKSKKVG